MRTMCLVVLLKPPVRLALVFALLAGGPANAAPTYSYKVIATYPHSTESYTEGFLYLDGIFYEGIGIKGRSAGVAVAPEAGRTLQRHDLPPEYFGEGIVDRGPTIYQWTWKSLVCFVYDRFTLQVLKQFTYMGEGWGMTADGKRANYERRYVCPPLPRPQYLSGNSTHRRKGREQSRRATQ